MSTIAEIVKKTAVGQTNAIVSAGNSPADLDAFGTLIDEARALEQDGVIEITEEGPDRVRFKRLR